MLSKLFCNWCFFNYHWIFSDNTIQQQRLSKPTIMKFLSQTRMVSLGACREGTCLPELVKNFFSHFQSSELVGCSFSFIMQPNRLKPWSVLKSARECWTIALQTSTNQVWRGPPFERIWSSWQLKPENKFYIVATVLRWNVL